MQTPGPPLEPLLRRLTETPRDFLDEPQLGSSGGVFVPALVNDLLLMHGARAPTPALQRFHGAAPDADRNRLALILVAVWLLAHEWFVSARIKQVSLLALLDQGMGELASVAAAQKFVTDPDRREELARMVLARLGYRPAGETVAQASDRLSSLSSVERRRLLAESRDAEKRAKAIREALIKKAAVEAADKWSRE